MSAAPTVGVREATADDLPSILEFNLRLAAETESKTLDPAVLAQGIRAALDDPARLRYWVAYDAADPNRLVGQAAVTREWSDWRCGDIWWFQSVYVREQDRKKGTFRALHAAIRAAALADPVVIGLRLYVEQGNQRAKTTYLALGMKPGGYEVFEEVWPDRFGVRPPSV